MKPDIEKYLSAGGGVVPVWEEMVVDTETPISIYGKVAGGEEYSYLLESVAGGERIARYSFIGLDPIAVFKAKNSLVEIEEGGQKKHRFGDATENLREFLGRYRSVPSPELPCFFGGAVGYLGYDWVRYLERLPNRTVDELGLPDGLFALFRVTLIYDHAKNTLKLVVLTQPKDDPKNAYSEAAKTIQSVKEKICRFPGEAARLLAPGDGKEDLVCRSSLSREEYIRGVERIKEYIRAGDVFQTVFSTRLSARCFQPPMDVYRCLRSINPSPYMFFLDFKDFQIVGASPEMLVKVENGRVETRPIAGTRPRGNSPEEDLGLAAEMSADPKEKAEHMMLVDLGRNDVGRIARYGSVGVPELMQVEQYSHVMHLVSSVTGELAPGKDALDAVMACFPAGTVSGAPKVRAMEIIEELERTRRGPYAGAVGYLGLNGNIDTCIAIRTIVFCDRTAHVQAGAGIVADSQPEREYEESINKSRALLKAISMAEGRVLA